MDRRMFVGSLFAALTAGALLKSSETQAAELLELSPAGDLPAQDAEDAQFYYYRPRRRRIVYRVRPRRVFYVRRRPVVYVRRRRPVYVRRRVRRIYW